jgi:hypothetical protein
MQKPAYGVKINDHDVEMSETWTSPCYVVDRHTFELLDIYNLLSLPYFLQPKPKLSSIFLSQFALICYVYYSFNHEIDIVLITPIL